MSELLHDRENADDLNKHLKDNGEKFNRQCVMVLDILYRGGRYTGKQINDLLDIACGDRRLRDLFVARNDIKREWVYTEDGKKTRWKEYWLQIPPQQTKKELIEKANKAIESLQKVERTLVTVFELPDDPPSFIQSSLF